ncbi:hypothetical protein CGRA01v4_03156 [Colletotrichum graminicola]|nr:hypothetical protein CGRA01v4_03156 [Colletotrichum graminicola]
MRGAFPSVMVLFTVSRPSHRRRIPSHPRTARRNSTTLSHRCAPVAALSKSVICDGRSHYIRTRRETRQLGGIVALHRIATSDPYSSGLPIAH